MMVDTVEERCDSCTLLIVSEQHAEVCRLKTLIGNFGYRCTACTSSQEAIQRFHDSDEIGIVLCDLHLSGMDGIALVQELRRASAPSRVFEAIILTGRTELCEVTRAMQAGIADCHQHPVDPDQLLLAISRLAQRLQRHQQDRSQRQRFTRKLRDLTESLDELHDAVDQYRCKSLAPSAHSLATAMPPPFDQLSLRQIEIARRISMGLTNGQIARELELSENTVKLYVSQILRISHTRSRTQLALALAQVNLAD
ncbi:response regulator transcription factor [Pseudomonas sp. D(2018)]|uniref:response regulator transcription factor n=1 Tax=Pseudomonas sp. D(2018) TaxID=2502238 RepID=UPI0010F92777|nr:response regulator transcription factor [Pseudomonas sp. D(2018)]